jgi:hypothetical protein
MQKYYTELATLLFAIKKNIFMALATLLFHCKNCMALAMLFGKDISTEVVPKLSLLVYVILRFVHLPRGDWFVT